MSPSPAFLVLCHADPALFRRLCGRLHNVGHVIAHVDLKSDLAAFQAPGVVFTPRRISIQWGGFTMILATLELIRTALLRFPEASHFVLLSGADYPIKSDGVIKEFFQDRERHNFIKLYDMNRDPRSFWRHVHEYYFHDVFGGRSSPQLARGARRLAEFAARPFKKKWPRQFKAAAGSQWWALTPECCQYISDTVQADPFWTRFWRWSFAPDEIFFHTLIANSRFSESVDGYVDNPFQDQTASLHLIDRDLFKLFSIADLDRVRGSSKIFVRKVHSLESAKLLDALDLDN